MTGRQNAGAAREGGGLWPGGAWLAFAPLLVFEAWSERCAREGKLATTPRPPLPPAAGGIIDTRNFTWAAYGGKVGLKRLLDICRRHEVRTTIAANGLAVEGSPSLVKEAARGGHEIAAHGYDQGMPLYLMDGEGRRRDIEKCRTLIGETIGSAPLGWESPGLGYTEDTLEILVEMGFLWHSDNADADLPYSLAVSGGFLVELPVNMDLNDNTTYVRYGHSPVTHLEKIRCTLETLLRERAERPALLCPVFHCHNSGRPMGAWAFEETLKLVESYPGVWQATYREVAEAWVSASAAGAARPSGGAAFKKAPSPGGAPAD